MRRSKAKKHIILKDSKYNDVQVTKFVNNMMYDGKKEKSFNIFYDALEIVKNKNVNDEMTELEVFKKALANITPFVEVKSSRIGGATYQVPIPVRESRKESLAMKWMIRYSRERNDNSMSQKLANEILAAYKEEGGAFKKKADTLRMAEANRAFSQFKF